MAIPLAGMRFPDRAGPGLAAGLLARPSARNRPPVRLGANDRNEQCQPCQWGTVSGIDGRAPGQGPGDPALGHRLPDRRPSPTPWTPTPDCDNEDVKGEGLAGRQVLAIERPSPSRRALNPDFSQIEADADQIDVNTTILQRYAERRPFFQEGNDLFRTMFNSFYTRMVNDPQVAAKGTARWSRTSVA